MRPRSSMRRCTSPVDRLRQSGRRPATGSEPLCPGLAGERVPEVAPARPSAGHAHPAGLNQVVLDLLRGELPTSPLCWGRLLLGPRAPCEDRIEGWDRRNDMHHQRRRRRGLQHRRGWQWGAGRVRAGSRHRFPGRLPRLRCDGKLWRRCSRSPSSPQHAVGEDRLRGRRRAGCELPPRPMMQLRASTCLHHRQLCSQLLGLLSLCEERVEDGVGWDSHGRGGRRGRPRCGPLHPLSVVVASPDGCAGTPPLLPGVLPGLLVGLSVSQ